MVVKIRDKNIITTKEWIEVLEDKDVISPKMLNIFKIMYNCKNHTATTSEIINIRSKEGLNDEKSYNTLIRQNGKRVKNYFSKKPLINKEGNETFWNWFFNGRKLHDGFQFQLKEELVNALEELYMNITNKTFYEYLIDEGYYFDKYMIENYLLSLKVKPFTILTGNSGTGKTKLSQLFAKYLTSTEELISNEKTNTIENETNDYITVKAKTNYSSWANNGWTLSNKYFEELIPFSEINKKYNIEIDSLATAASIRLAVQLFYNKENEELKKYFKELYEIDKNQTVNLKIKKEPLKKLFVTPNKIANEINLEQNSNHTAITNRQWILSTKFFEYLPLTHSFIPCEIEVNNIKSKGKVRVTAQLTYDKDEQIQNYLKENEGKKVNLKIKSPNWDLTKFNPTWDNNQEIKEEIDIEYKENTNKKQYQIIPVGANWTENRNIVGYYNPITEEYQSTPAYELIKEANKDKDNPYFLILDEMNLSHVERYFADFLSAIESGENIPLYGTEEELTIPNNLFIIGTVNVDETTYMFSPKVLDRANTIEFETYSAYDYMTGEFNLQSPQGNLNYLQDPLSDLNIENLGIKELKEEFQGVKINGADFWEIFSEEIFNFQITLKESGFDFGFRVINEIARFMYVAWKYEGKPTNWTNWNRYLDAQIKQKMLPKLHGSEKIIGETLGNLYAACDPNYPTSAKKLEEMMDVLEKQRYVSFIN